MSKKLDPKEVEIFLLDNLNFFESRESLVSELKFKHDVNSASSLLERQVKKLRDDQKDLVNVLNSFIDNASANESLFIKSKKLTLAVLSSNSRKSLVNNVIKNIENDFNVDLCKLDFYSNNEIEILEKETNMSFHKGIIHCGSYATKKMHKLFNDESIESMVVSVFVSGKEIVLLKMGSKDRSKYMGDEDTTFIEYIRDIIEQKLNSF